MPCACSLVREFVSYREEPWGKSEIVNASSDEIAVERLVDIELSFQGLEIILQEVIVAHVAFNAFVALGRSRAWLEDLLG